MSNIFLLLNDPKKLAVGPHPRYLDQIMTADLTVLDFRLDAKSYI
jgi:hypothetical protein